MKLKQQFAGDNYYYLGRGKEDGTHYFLQEPSFDCDWYWGVNYLEGFRSADLSKVYDMDSHEHFLHGSSDKNKPWHDWLLKEVDSPLCEKDLWLIMEIACSLKTLREYMDLSYIGGSHMTTSKEEARILKDEDAYNDADKKIRALKDLLDKIYEEAQEYVDKEK